MDDLTRIRDEYESALDEVESKRAEYHALIRRKAMAGRDVEDLATETGLGDSRLHLLLRPSRWNPLVWLLRVLRGASVARSATRPGKADRLVPRRGLARPTIMIGILPIVGLLALSWPMMWWGDWDFSLATRPQLAAMFATGDFRVAAQVTEIVGWLFILWLPPLILAFLMARGAWRWLRHFRRPSPAHLPPA